MFENPKKTPTHFEKKINCLVIIDMLRNVGKPVAKLCLVYRDGNFLELIICNSAATFDFLEVFVVGNANPGIFEIQRLYRKAQFILGKWGCLTFCAVCANCSSRNVKIIWLPLICQKTHSR